MSTVRVPPAAVGPDDEPMSPDEPVPGEPPAEPGPTFAAAPSADTRGARHRGGSTVPAGPATSTITEVTAGAGTGMHRAETVRTDQAWRERLPAGADCASPSIEQPSNSRAHSAPITIGARRCHTVRGTDLRCDVDARSEPTPLLCQRRTPGTGRTLPGRITIWESPAPRPLLNGHSGTTGDGCRWHG